MQSESIKIGLNRQLAICALMCGLAAIVIFIFHRQPYIAPLLAGLPISYQVALGVGIGGLYWLTSLFGYKFMANRKSVQSTAESYSRLDLSGWNPLWFALAAGFGEELFFRGSLQPLLGIFATSVIFVAAHARAYRLNVIDKRVLVQVLVIFVISVGLGFIARYAGLIVAAIVHTSMDIAGLYVVRRATQVKSTAAV